MARWQLRVQEYNPGIQYKLGAKNHVEDCLSRNCVAVSGEVVEVGSEVGNNILRSVQIPDPKLKIIIDNLTVEKQSEEKN